MLSLGYFPVNRRSLRAFRSKRRSPCRPSLVSCGYERTVTDRIRGSSTNEVIGDCAESARRDQAGLKNKIIAVLKVARRAQHAGAGTQALTIACDEAAGLTLEPAIFSAAKQRPTSGAMSRR